MVEHIDCGGTLVRHISPTRLSLTQDKHAVIEVDVPETYFICDKCGQRGVLMMGEE